MRQQLIHIIFLSISIVCLVSLTYCFKQSTVEDVMIKKAFDVDKIISLFCVNAEDINSAVDTYIGEAQDIVDAIIAIPDEERTFFNTAKALDELFVLSNVAIAHRVYEALELLSPEKDIREAAHNAYIKIQQFWIEQVSTNKKIYTAVMAYADQQKENEGLTSQQRYFLNDMVSDFKRAGLSLPDEQLEKVKQLKNELSVLTADFDRNIAQDNSFIVVSRDDLTGLDDAFIDALKTDDNGLCIVGVDYPTYFRVMDNCSNAATRKKLYIAFQNRAYPINGPLLQEIIVKRDELAHFLGYIDFASLDIDDQMAHSTERVSTFLNDLIKKVMPKVAQEKQLLTNDLPESVVLSGDGTIFGWDFAYLENSYKKNNFSIDEQKIAEYFPMEKTIAELLDIYRQFFGIEFKQVPVQGLWHEDVIGVQVLNKEGDTLLGTLLLDLYPRANKYSHACHTTIIPATMYTQDGVRIPDVSILIANFTKATDTQPSLLKRDEVKTFFHEFGHALHAVLGATTIASLSGTRTKTDFVELPSQMLEEWLWDKDILRKVSCHYQTGEPLPDTLIDSIIASKDLISGYWVLRQVFLSLFALSCFEEAENKDPYLIFKTLQQVVMSSIIAYCPDTRFYASFGHLTGYGAKYYGYLWSKVFALDLFVHIKKQGLLNPVVGQKYVKEVIGKGGVQDPNELLYNFLGREPNAQAFFEEMGL